MNKSIKKIYGILLVLVMLCGVVCADSAIANAAMSKSVQHKLYANTMKMYAKKARASYKRNAPGYDLGSVVKKVLYLYVDIDKNGIDELIMRYGGSRNTAVGTGYGESTTIYTIKNGKVVTVLDHSNVNPLRHDNFVHIFKNRSRIDMGLSHGYDDHTFYKYFNGKLYTNSNTAHIKLNAIKATTFTT